MLSLVESVMVLNPGGGGVNLKVLIASVDMLSCIRTAFSCIYLFEMISRMLSKPGEKAHFAKIMVIRWVFVEILSRDMVTSANFTTVYCKKRGFKIPPPPSLLAQH